MLLLHNNISSLWYLDTFTFHVFDTRALMKVALCSYAFQFMQNYAPEVDYKFMGLTILPFPVKISN